MNITMRLAATLSGNRIELRQCLETNAGRVAGSKRSRKCGASCGRGGARPGRATIAIALRCQSQTRGAGLHGGDTEGDVFVEIDAEVGGAARDVVAVDVGGEGDLLQLLADAFGLQPLQARRPDQRTGGDEPAQFVTGVERLVEARDA